MKMQVASLITVSTPEGNFRFKILIDDPNVDVEEVIDDLALEEWETATVKQIAYSEVVSE